MSTGIYVRLPKTDYVPTFEIGQYFEKTEDEYIPILIEPIDWAETYTNYYYKIETAQGFATPATQAEIDKEATYTNPNLHRRIETDISPVGEQTAPSEYSVGVFGKNSYRVVKSYYHDENSTTSEVP